MKKMDGMKQSIPAMGEGPSENLEGAKGAMGKAAGNLGGMRSSSAVGNEGEALQKLGKAREGLEGLKQNLSKGMGGRIPLLMFIPGSGGPGGQFGHEGELGVDRGDVNIPGKEQYKVPAEYREEILKAMKDPSPKKYKELIKDYYERLIE